MANIKSCRRVVELTLPPLNISVVTRIARHLCACATLPVATYIFAILLLAGMATNNEDYDSNRIELSPTVHTKHEHYVVARDKAGTYTVYTIDADDWKNLPLHGTGPSYVFDGDLEEYGARPVDVGPFDVETYDLATLDDELTNLKSLEIRHPSEELSDAICSAEPREAVYVGEHHGYNNTDERPRAEIFDVAAHAILNVEDAGRSDWYLIDDADEYEELYESVHDYVVDTAESFDELGKGNVVLETVGMVADKVARDLIESVGNIEYEPRETYLSDQEYEAWFSTRVRGMSYETAARKMNVSVETIKTYISRVSKKRQKAKMTLELLEASER